jgi:hypothetical protein
MTLHQLVTGSRRLRLRTVRIFKTGISLDKNGIENTGFRRSAVMVLALPGCYAALHQGTAKTSGTESSPTPLSNLKIQIPSDNVIQRSSRCSKQPISEDYIQPVESSTNLHTPVYKKSILHDNLR